MVTIGLRSLLALLLGLASPAMFAPPVAVGEATHSDPLRGDCTLTPEVEDALRFDLLLGDEDEAFVAYRDRRPHIYGLTQEPPSRPSMPADFEEAETLYLAYGAWSEYEETFATLLDVAPRHGKVHVVVAPSDRPAYDGMVKRLGIRSRRIVVDETVPVETVWMRDYGPRSVVDDGRLAFVDGAYFLNCPSDDAVPTKLAGRASVERVYRPGFRIEGGNLISNGRGLCLTTTNLAPANGLSEAATARVLERFYGCERTVFLLPMTGVVVDHVDMFAAFASPGVLLVGRFEPEQDAVNHLVLEVNAAALAGVESSDGEPLTVIRVPMPDHGVSGDGEPEGFVRSYVNLLPFNEVVFVPVYESDPVLEDAALDVIQDAFPDRLLVPVPAEGPASDGGAVHCLTMTVPSIARAR